MTAAQLLRRILVAALALALAACSTAPSKRPGGFYQDDGPPERAPADLAATPDAVPRIEPFHPYANRPYTALGRSFTPITDDRPFRQRGLASWYGRQFHGNRTSSGERYDMFAMTAAHPTLPIPSYARVTNVRTGASAIVRVNDRGPFKHDRVIDLSYAAATKLGIAAAGTGEVEVVRLTFADIRAGRYDGSGAAVAGATPPASPRAPLPPTSTQPAVTAAPSGPWSVQLGAFSIVGNAEALRERVAVLLEQNGAGLAGAERAPRVERDGGVFRVLVGALPDRVSAQSLAERLERLLERETALYLRP
ncbi:septal ring lytic transglycosylase RlpA family protein [Betaproteobacteria bacterium PRO7]|jgi:rare lipoprotein A|nr:septal ring lytic transglycosylase RlpA family protein [Betaproteobacteria bacterium PRO7]